MLTHISIRLYSLWGCEVFQLELCHLGFMEVIPELKTVLGQSDSSRPGESRLLIVTTDHFDIFG